MLRSDHQHLSLVLLIVLSSAFGFAQSAEIPLQLEGELVILPAEIHGTTLRLALDTSTIGIVLKDAATAEKAGLGLSDATLYGNGFGSEKGLKGQIKLQGQVEIAHIDFDVPAVIVGHPESSFSLAFQDEPLDGYVAISVFKSHVIEVSFSEGVTRLVPRSRFDSSSYLETRLKIIKDRTYIDAVLDNGQHEEEALLYLQSTLTEATFLERQASAHLLTGVEVQDIFVESSRGETESGDLMRLDSVTIGEFELRHVPSFIVSERLFLNRRRSVPNLAGFVGNHLLNRFDWAIDFRGRALYLKPNQRFGKVFRVNASGIFLQIAKAEDHTFIVAEVLPGAPAAKAGIAAGDKILSIQGRKTPQLGRRQARQLLEHSTEPISLVIERQGDRKTVSLQPREVFKAPVED